MIQDLNQRHVLEYKKTVEFLRFALGKRAPTKGMLGGSKLGGTSVVGGIAPNSVISASMISASQINNQSRLS